ncbi:hypothetical protein BofuT4_uP024100.1 [Botrytis cinerea T4]|uniref:Uncharacterized protein n=1 Tax=Botryotinia fuckeliana (strain T4) TaxID=999810 RepID=G2YFQ3_BOTF4|nr:hypothetical protein BofuT4_uP024100.1 [Botrytis cinerea T4]
MARESLPTKASQKKYGISAQLTVQEEGAISPSSGDYLLWICF